jgi:hypothetical protein
VQDEQLPRSVPALQVILKQAQETLDWWRARPGKVLESPDGKYVLGILENRVRQVIEQLEHVKRSPGRGGEVN